LYVYETEGSYMNYFIDLSYQKSLTLEETKWNQINFKIGIGK